MAQSDVPPTPSFAGISEAISELLAHLVIGRRFIYVHDWGTAVGLQIAMQAPDLVSGLIIQNANAHRTGFGPLWDAALKFWSEPTKENEAAATPDLTFEFTREQYTGGLPEEVAATIKGEPWVEDWRVMNLPGRMETHRALIADYKNHAARFDAIAGYLEKCQPPALMLWGRHEPYFDIAETLSWMQDLPRMEAHIFDGGHFLLETHAEPALSLMMDFIRRTQRPNLNQTSAGDSIRRLARLSRDVGQPDHILADPVISHKAERRPGSGEIWLAATKHDGVQVDSILIDQAKFGEALRQVRASNFDLPVPLGLQLPDCALEIILNKRGVGANRLQRARDDPFRLVPPRRREGVSLCIPFRMIVVPVTHDLIHLATIHTARLPLSLLDEVAEECAAWRKCHMVDVAVQGLVHSEHELSHTHLLSLRGTSARF